MENAKRALETIKDTDLRSRAIKSVADAVIYKSISEEMSKAICDIVGTSTILSFLSPLGESGLKKVIRQLQSDRSQIVHGRKNEVTDIEKKTAFVQNLVYTILKKVFLEPNA